MTDFRPLTETELAALPPERLIAYHHEARRHGSHDEARRALGILVWGFEDRVRYWVSRVVPKEHVEDVVGDVFVSAIGSSFEGAEVRQFGAWLREISRRRATDFHRTAERRPKQEPLPEEHEREEETWGTVGEVPDPTEELVERSVVEQALGELGEPHRRVVELAGPQDLGFDQRPAKEAARMVNDQFEGEMSDPMTDVNAHQILSRFRKRLRELVEGDARRSSDG